MAWIDDRIWCHPKLVGLTARAFRAYINGLAYSSGFACQGRLTDPQVKAIGASANVRRELVDAGLWAEATDRSGAIEIHDWAEHNSKRDERRAQDRERKRRQRERDNQRDVTRDIHRDETADVHTLTDEGSEGSDKNPLTVTEEQTRARDPDDGNGNGGELTDQELEDLAATVLEDAPA